jgi:ferredoxin
MPMLVWIDQDCCTGAGLCVDRCPDLFVVLEDGIGYVHDGESVLTDPTKPRLAVPARHERDAIDAAEHCPGECIYLDVESPDHEVDDDSDIHDADIVVDSS